MLDIDRLQVGADGAKGGLLLDGLSVSVKPGQAVGLVGPSGCGKTTFLRSVVGLIDPAGGMVTLEGRTPEQMGWPEFRRRVGFVPQRPVVWDGGVWQNLSRPGRFNTVSNKFDRQTGQSMLESVGLHGKLDADAQLLSEGERQRVCLVRSLMCEPKYLLLDEPTSALDTDAIGLVGALLADTMRGDNGCGPVVASHDRAFIERLCVRVIDLADYVPAGQAVAGA